MNNEKIKEQVVKEYLRGGVSMGSLALKYNYSRRTILRWMMADKEKKEKQQLQQASKFEVMEKEDMPTDVKQLQAALRDSRLKNRLLEAMIEIADEQFGTDIKKKAGTRQSKK
jgi:transposase-like protein